VRNRGDSKEEALSEDEAPKAVNAKRLPKHSAKPVGPLLSESEKTEDTVMYHDGNKKESSNDKKKKKKTKDTTSSNSGSDSESTDSGGSGSDDEDDEERLCRDCGEEMEADDEIYKGCCDIHRKCGMLRERLQRWLKADSPEMLKVLMDARKTDPKTYQTLVLEVQKDKSKQLSGGQKSAIQKLGSGLLRTRQLRGQGKMLFFGKLEFQQHWKHRLGINDKAARKMWKDAKRADNACWRKEGDVDKLGVLQPFALNCEDILARASGGTDMKKLTAGFGEGLDNALVSAKGNPLRATKAMGKAAIENGGGSDSDSSDDSGEGGDEKDDEDDDDEDSKAGGGDDSDDAAAAATATPRRKAPNRRVQGKQGERSHKIVCCLVCPFSQFAH
jgi:hypothetical protein